MTIATSGDELTIVFHGLEKFWGLKSKIVLKREDIENMQWSPALPDRKNYRGLRCPGTAIPGYFLAGSYFCSNHWEFWYVFLKRPWELVIHTRKRYKIIRLTVDEPTAQAALQWKNEH